ncbi:prefoldin subunit alpha [Candidatus Woesearchaeota archaeon]|nr:prefoldin subunit alpha [Candidatus Woesearchaeota archaeon]
MKENLKEKYMEYQELVQQLQQLQQNITSLEKHIVDLSYLDDGLTQLKQTKVNDEVLMPFGSGIFLKGEIKDNNSVIMNVGNNVCVEKTVDEAKETVEKQLGDVTNVLEQLKEEVNNTVGKLNILQEDFSKVREEALEE